MPIIMPLRAFVNTFVRTTGQQKKKGRSPFLFSVFDSMPVGHEALGHVGQHGIIAELVDVDAVTAAAIRVEAARVVRRCVVTSINP